MKVLLTGINGNLGHEVALDLDRRGFKIVPIIRTGKNVDLNTGKISFTKVIHNNLLSDEELKFSGSADCIVHCAGNIHFRAAGDSNEKMTTKQIGRAPSELQSQSN